MRREWTNDEERLRWLLTFIDKDLTTLRRGARLDLTDDMARLLEYRPADVDLSMVDPPDPYAHDLRKLRGEISESLSWTDAQVADVQAKLKTGIAHFEAGRSWTPFEKALSPTFTVNKDRSVSRSYSGSYDGFMLAAAVDLLVSHWPRIRRCALTSCSKLFLQHDARQRFHDPWCAHLQRQGEKKSPKKRKTKKQKEKKQVGSKKKGK